MRPSAEEHIRMLQEYLEAERDATVAEYQEWADRDAAIGHERGRKHWQEAADRMRAYRFDGEDDAA